MSKESSVKEMTTCTAGYALLSGISIDQYVQQIPEASANHMFILRGVKFGDVPISL